MSHRLDSLLKRSPFGVALALLAVLAAATQAFGSDASWRFENGRLVRASGTEAGAVCRSEIQSSPERVARESATIRS
jgi:hypothetical protein